MIPGWRTGQSTKEAPAVRFGSVRQKIYYVSMPSMK